MVTRIRGKAAGRRREPLFLEEHIAKKEWGESANVEHAKRTGRDRITMWKWRRHPHNLKEAQLAELADALDLEGPDDLRHHPDRPSLDKMVSRVPDDLQDAIYDVVHRLVAGKK